MSTFRRIFASLVLSVGLHSNHVLALECVDASGHAFGAFKSISIDEKTGVIKLVGYDSQEILPPPKLVENTGVKDAFSFNLEIDSDKKGVRLFKLFYSGVLDEWRMIDALVFNTPEEVYLVGVSGSIEYSCEKEGNGE